jgi:hypothetical protein
MTGFVQAGLVVVGSDAVVSVSLIEGATVPMVPRASKTSLYGLVRRPELREAGLRFPPHAPAPWVGTTSLDGPDAFWSDVAAQIEKREPQ